MNPGPPAPAASCSWLDRRPRCHLLVQDWEGRPGHFGTMDFDSVLGPKGWCNAEEPEISCPCYLVWSFWRLAGCMDAVSCDQNGRAHLVHPTIPGRQRGKVL